MRRPLLPLLVLLALATPASAQQATGAGVALLLEPDAVTVSPGGATSTTLAVRNDLDHAVALTLGARPVDGVALNATLGRTDLKLAPGASERVVVKVSAGPRAALGPQRIEVGAKDGNDTLVTTMLRVDVVAAGSPPPPTFTFDLSSLDVHAHAGESVTLTAHVTNLRDAPGLLLLRVAAPDGVTVDAPAEVKLRARETRDVPLVLSIAENATPGARIVELGVEDPLSSFAATRPPMRSIALTVEPPLPTATLDAGTLAWTGAGVAALGGAGAGLWWLKRRGLAGLPLLAPLYTRIARNKVLDQPTRERIVALVKAEPGVTFGEIQRRLDVAAGQLTHHARMLEDAGVLFSTPDGQQRRFFHVGHGRVDAVPPLAERALAHLQRDGPRTLADLARDLGVSRQALHYHVKKLQAAARVSVDEQGRITPMVGTVPQGK